MADFVWGANGARMTPEDIVAQRKVADALATQAGDGSPLPVGTRGAGEWTQGLNRIAKGISAGMDYREADAASRANADDNKTMIAALLGGGGQVAPTVATAAPVVAAPALASAPAAPGTTGKIYSNDEPSPLDPPSGTDRTRMIATILGEAGNEPQLGKNAVASVIRTRAADGGYGGDTPSAVVTAPNQFEPWNTQAGRDRMAAAAADPRQTAAADAAIASAYGEGGKAPEDPTEGMTHFYSPAGQAALGRAPPSWAGGESVTIGGHVFNSPDDVPAAPVQIAGAIPPGVAKVAAAVDPSALPDAAAPVQGALPTAQAVAVPAAAPSPAVAKVSSALNPAVLGALTSPYASEGTKKIATLIATQQMAAANKEHYTPQTDADGNKYDLGSDGKRTMFQAADKSTPAQKDYEYYKANFQPTENQPTPMGFDTWTTAKAKAGAVSLSNIGNVDTKSGDSYDSQMTGGLAKSHAALVNGVEGAQTRARDINAMQAAVDAIQKNGGTTGGMAPEQVLKLQKTINTGANWMGVTEPFDEKDLSDKEFLTKFNRSMAGAQAKDAVGSRVTNFEMGNYLKSNPGLDMSLTGNQRLLGIQGQIEQRNIDVGNALRAATAQGISSGKHIDPVTAQKIITDYDEAHHIQDPITGQDLTKNYALPEFNRTGQGGTSNAAMAADHAANVTKIGGYTIRPVSP